ncbi:prolyl oligopeptidase family serine peptidase [Duganella sp. CY15W]|uniref:alpha/beta hydrolase family protein n=1 Tax=Duganella sp. CY15W TaxID=2692172 RepID=UPI00136D58AE|nr:prolyl oligopeptidase family serine peptidase [Duganella sp. CY15W]
MKASGLLTALALAGAAQAQEQAQEITRFEARGTGFIEYQVPPAGDAPPVEYYISRTTAPAPLVLLIQGSGCTPGFSGLGTPRRSANIFGFLDTAWTGKYAVMTVNKPYSPATPQSDGTATACPEQFNQYFTLENWTRDLARAVQHARSLPWVAQGPLLVIGVSEGATAAAALAARDAAVTNVAMVSGSGATQYYDFIVSAYRSGANDSEVKQKLDELDATRQRIFAASDSATDFAWGHPYKRWSSFFRASNTTSLLKSRSKVYVVSGMQDSSTPILSAEAMAADLRAAGRDVTVRRLPDVGHTLQPAGASGDALWPEYQRILNWFQP